MTKRFVFLMLLGFFVMSIHAQKSEYVVRSFGANMQSWGQTSKLEYQKNLQKLCDGAKSVRVCDEIVETLASKNGYIGVGGSYFLETYLNCLIKEIKKGIHIQYSNFKTVHATETTVYDTRGLELITCDIVISGSVNYNVKDLFYVRNGKISKIDKYEETIDKHTGKRKVVVDFSGIDFDDEAFAITYNYSKSFPLGLSFEYAWPWFRLGLDVGVDFKKDQYILDDVKMTDIMHYERTKKILDPKCYVTVTPSLYFKYVSVGCGVGALYMSGKKEESSSSYSSSNGISSSGTTFATQDCEKLNFMLRPVIKGFIPISEDYMSIVISAGYDYIFGYKEKNGLNFGIGLQFVIE